MIVAVVLLFALNNFVGFAAAARGVPVCVALFDLDRFKAFNDRHGHVAGDQVLKVFGKVLKGYTRAMDLSARFGGEEFLSVLLDARARGVRGRDGSDRGAAAFVLE